MSAHDFDHMSDFCKGCGIARMEAFERRALDARCPEDDRVTWLKARHQMAVLIDPVLELLGIAEPPVKH